MMFRDFVEHNKDATQVAVAGALDRDPAPTLTLDTPAGVLIIALDPSSFDSRVGRINLVHGFVVPMIGEHAATQAAWAFAAWASRQGDVPASRAPDRQEVAVVTVIDGERHEVWQGDLYRDGSRQMVAGWHPWPPNEADGPLLIQPVQEALR